MTSTTLKSRKFKTPQHPSAGEAFHEMVGAARRFTLALLAIVQPRAKADHCLTASEEANRLRNFASQQAKADPRFAADLFAAADRHELTHGV